MESKHGFILSSRSYFEIVLIFYQNFIGIKFKWQHQDVWEIYDGAVDF